MRNFCLRKLFLFFAAEYFYFFTLLFCLAIICFFIIIYIAEQPLDNFVKRLFCYAVFLCCLQCSLNIVHFATELFVCLEQIGYCLACM